jgi:hypothetical protein
MFSLICSYLYFKLAKMSSFSFYLLCFFFYKIEKEEGRAALPRGWHHWLGEVVRKGVGV